MISRITKTIEDWAKGLSGGAEISYQMPPQAESAVTIHIYLMEISDDASRHNTGRPAIQPSVRYLVTTSGDDFRKAHDLLYVLLFSALEYPDYEVAFEPAGSPLWLALQIPPRPAFTIRAPLDREWPPVSGHPVKDVKVGMVELVWLFGRLLGPDDLPIAQAVVELRDVQKNAYAYTDREGGFRIPGVSAAPARKTLTATFEGREQVFSCAETGDIDTPQVFRMDNPQ